MSFLNKFESVMLKIFQIMDQLNKFLNQTTEPGLSLEHDRKKTKRKHKNKKRKSKNRKVKNRKVKKKLQGKPVTKPEILGGFDYKRIGDRMMGQDQQ
jgi:hypothetical protein